MKLHSKMPILVAFSHGKGENYIVKAIKKHFLFAEVRPAVLGYRSHASVLRFDPRLELGVKAVT
jgi:hypothetical protein